MNKSFLFFKKSVLEYNAHFSKSFLIKILLFNSKREWKEVLFLPGSSQGKGLHFTYPNEYYLLSAINIAIHCNYAFQFV